MVTDPERTFCATGGTACRNCGDDVPSGRSLLGYTTCLPCGDIEARKVKHTVMPAYSKGAYQLVSLMDIAHTNPKR